MLKKYKVFLASSGELHVQKAIEQGEKRHKDLMNIIKSHAKLKELAVNPLLLTIIAIVHRTRAVLPRERHKLYEECLKVMIELWNLANRKLDISFSYDNSMAHLANIALRLMEKVPARKCYILSDFDAVLIVSHSFF